MAGQRLDFIVGFFTFTAYSTKSFSQMNKTSILYASLLFFAVIFSSFKKDSEFVEILVKDPVNNNYYYEKVVEVAGKSKEEMFKRAKDWIVTNLKTSDNNLSADEKDLRIVNSGNLLMSNDIKGGGFHLTQGIVNFKITLSFKDGKYKIRVDNIILRTSLDGGGVVVNETNPYGDLKEKKPFHNKYKKEANEKIGQLATSLENAILKGGDSDKW